MLSTGMNPSSTAASASASDSVFRASHPATLRAALQPATPSSSAGAAASSSSSRAKAFHRSGNPSSSVSSTSSSSARSSHHAPASLANVSSASVAPPAPMTSQQPSSNSHRLPDRQRPSSVHSSHQGSERQDAHQDQEQVQRQQQEQQSGRHSPLQQGGEGNDEYRYAPPYEQEQQIPQNSPSSPRLQPTYCSSRSLGGSEATSPSRIKVRNLSHIQSFASEELLASPNRTPSQNSQDGGRQYEISSMPVTDIIEMVAGLLTKITSTNDLQHEHLHRQIPPPEGTSNLSPQTTSVLAFHGKNVPAITILSYLSRIHKYCPTTYEVFLSLLVYFDRMTEMVNKGLVQSLQRQEQRQQRSTEQQQKHQPPNSSASSPNSGPSTPSTSTPRGHSSQSSIITPPSSGCVDTRSHDPALPSPTSPSSSSQSTSTVQAPAPTSSSPSPSRGLSDDTQPDPTNFSQYFVVDSFNIHRLVIAGVTCASKFFSDVFYTNSRYAKVGGLPLLELNHLELQFLVLNDFRLSVPVEELEAYGTMLVEFYAREVVTEQRQREEEQWQKEQAQARPQSREMAGATGSDTGSGRRGDDDAYMQ